MDPDPTDDAPHGYASLAGRLAAAAETIWRGARDPDLLVCADLWSHGLRQLDVTAERARAAFELVSAGMSRAGRPDADGDALAAAYAAFAPAETAEQYHIHALVALAQPLWEAAARAYLSFPSGLPARDETRRHDPWWPEFLDALERSGGEPASLSLLPLARTVDASLVPARDRLVAHPLAGHIGARQRDRTGQLVLTGRLAFWADEHRADGYDDLLRINAALPASEQSPERNPFELQRDLARRATRMPTSLRRRYARATRDLGFELDFRRASAALVGMLEALAVWAHSITAYTRYTARERRKAAERAQQAYWLSQRK